MLKDEIVKNIQANLPAKKEEDKPAVVPSSALDKEEDKSKIVSDTNEDTEFVRNNLKDVLTKATDAISNLTEMAKDSEEPNVYNALAKLIVGTADLGRSILEIQGKKKSIVEKEDSSKKATNTPTSQTTNHTIFVGSTTELQKLLENQKGINLNI